MSAIAIDFQLPVALPRRSELAAALGNLAGFRLEALRPDDLFRWEIGIVDDDLGRECFRFTVFPAKVALHVGLRADVNSIFTDLVKLSVEEVESEFQAAIDSGFEPQGLRVVDEGTYDSSDQEQTCGYLLWLAPTRGF